MSENYLRVTRLDMIPTWLEVYRGLGSSPSLEDSRNEQATHLANKVSTWCGDITRLKIDAIVNSTNRSLLGGRGRTDDAVPAFPHVDGAIHRVAGPQLKEESRTLAPCKVGEAKITSGYRLPAKYVIHTVGPHGERRGKLKQCYEQSLALASEKGLRSIAFPCISTGVHGYPRRAAAKVAMLAVKKYLENNGDDIDRVVFCLFLDEDKGIYRQLLKKYFSLE